MGPKKCKREHCINPPAPRQVYCSRECAPLGYLSKEAPEMCEEKKRARAAKAEKKRQLLMDCAAMGMNIHEACEEMGLSVNMTNAYCRRWNIKLSRRS